MRITLLFLFYLQFRGGWGSQPEVGEGFLWHANSQIVQEFLFAIDCNIDSSFGHDDSVLPCQPHEWDYIGDGSPVQKYVDPAPHQKLSEKVYATPDPKPPFQIGVVNPLCCLEKSNYPDLCPYCYKFTYEVGKRCGVFLKLTTKVKNGGMLTHWQTYESPPRAYCNACRQVDCLTECSNGQFASEYPVYDAKTQLQMNTKLECRPCLRGTWNTCAEGSTCRWAIPDQVGDFSNHATSASGQENYNTIYAIDKGPVGNCYSCELSKTHPIHYSGGDDFSKITSKEVYCEGGSKSPKDCPGIFVSSPDMSTCICPDGTYGDMTTKVCTDCESGYFCVNGEKAQCPIHMYQDKKGQAQCKPCTNTGEEHGRAEYKCPTNQLLQWCRPTDILTQNRSLGKNCKSCAQCLFGSQLEDTSSPYKVRCYDN